MGRSTNEALETRTLSVNANPQNSPTTIIIATQDAMISASHFTPAVACLLLDIIKASDDANDPVNILEIFDGIGSYIFALLFVIFSLHLLVQPNWAMIDLMKTYLDEGSRISGTVLDCEPPWVYYKQEVARRGHVGVL
jgi:hypothetical protein